MEIQKLEPCACSKRLEQIRFIVVHYTACLCGARAVAASMRRCGRASTHYIVDAKEVVQCVDDHKSAWHVGGANAKNLCAACNQNSIGVDLCERKLSTKTKSVCDCDWYFDESTFKRGALLVAMLANKYNVPMSNIVRHYDVTRKLCPRPFCGNDINAFTGTTGDHEWSGFLTLVESLRQHPFE